MERVNPQTSHDAYRSITPEQLSRHYSKIMEALKVLGSASAEQIAKHLTMEHSQVNRRMSEMFRLEMIYKPGKKVLTKSGRNAYVWAIRGTGQKEEAIEHPHTYRKLEKTSSDFAIDIIKKTKQINLF